MLDNFLLYIKKIFAVKMLKSHVKSEVGTFKNAPKFLTFVKAVLLKKTIVLFTKSILLGAKKILLSIFFGFIIITFISR